MSLMIRIVRRRATGLRCYGRRADEVNVNRAEGGSDMFASGEDIDRRRFAGRHFGGGASEIQSFHVLNWNDIWVEMTRVSTTAGSWRCVEAPMIVGVPRAVRLLTQTAQEFMNTVDELLPLASVVVIYLTRMIELGARRDTTAGAIRERLTLRLFVLAGTLMVAGSVVEFFVRHSTLKWWTFAAGWMCAAVSVVIRRQAIAA